MQTVQGQNARIERHQTLSQFFQTILLYKSPDNCAREETLFQV